jgi:hypothetical protein
MVGYVGPAYRTKANCVELGYLLFSRVFMGETGRVRTFFSYGSTSCGMYQPSSR